MTANRVYVFKPRLRHWYWKHAGVVRVIFGWDMRHGPTYSDYGLIRKAKH